MIIIYIIIHVIQIIQLFSMNQLQKQYYNLDKQW